MAESKSSFINQILDSFARDLGFKNRLSEMGGNINNTFKDMRNTLNSMSLDGVRKFLQENVHGGSSVSSASAAEKRVNRAAPNVRVALMTGNRAKPNVRSGIKTGTGKGSSAVGTTGMGVRSGAKTGTAKRKSSVKDVAPLGGSSYKIKSGDTLSAIARKNNTTVAALMKMNPKIKDKDKIRAGQFIKVGSPTRAAAKTKSVKGIRDFATSIAEAKRRGLTEYKDVKTGRMKAAVTADELKKSGLSLRAYLNKMKKKKK